MFAFLLFVGRSARNVVDLGKVWQLNSPQCHARLHLENLSDRIVPATFVVAFDAIDPVDDTTTFSLREAIDDTEFTASGNGYTSDFVSLPAGSVISRVVRVVTDQTDSTETGIWTNTATVTSPDGTTDHSVNNNAKNPTLEQWVNNDQFLFAGGNVNLDAPIGNPPSGGLDPSGLQPTTAQQQVDAGVALFMKSPEGKKLYDSLFQGGIKFQATAAVKTANWNNNPKNPTININPDSAALNGNPDKIAGIILVELLNASQSVNFTAIANKARKGDLSRIDYAIAMENVEYDQLATHHRIASAAVAANIWQADADRYAKFYEKNGKPAEFTFDDYLNIQLGNGHTMKYAADWTHSGAMAAWTKNNPCANMDDPTTALAGGINKQLIHYFQKEAAKISLPK